MALIIDRLDSKHGFQLLDRVGPFFVLDSLRPGLRRFLDETRFGLRALGSSWSFLAISPGFLKGLSVCIRHDSKVFAFLICHLPILARLEVVLLQHLVVVYLVHLDLVKGSKDSQLLVQHFILWDSCHRWRVVLLETNDHVRD